MRTLLVLNQRYIAVLVVLFLSGCEKDELASFNLNGIKNSDFSSEQGWETYPSGPFPGRNGDPGLGVYIDAKAGHAVLNVRHYKWFGDPQEPSMGELSTRIAVESPSTLAAISYEAVYAANPPFDYGGATMVLSVSKDASFDSIVFQRSYSDEEVKVGTTLSLDNQEFEIDGGKPWSGTLFVRLKLSAFETKLRRYSNPQFHIRNFRLDASGLKAAADD